MRIAFDLDDTLIPCRYPFLVETPKRKLFSKFTSYESLRKGTKDIFYFCKQQNWQIWIYTTSYRSTFYIRKLFWLYGIKLDGVVNQSIHTKKVTVRSTKYPLVFGIDILIDDSEGVRLEGEKYNFKTIRIDHTDEC